MPQHSRPFSLTPLALAAVAALAVPSAHADVRYTSQMTFGAPPADASQSAVPAGMTMPGVRTTTSVKDMRERIETSMSMGPIQQNTVTLTLCDKHQTVKLNPDLKIYTVAPIGVATFGPPARRPGMKDSMPEGKPGVGHITLTFGVQDLGMEKVAELDAHHFKMTVRTQTTGCLGDSDHSMLLEEWVAPVKGGLNCPERFSPTRTMTNERGCRITYDMKGDWDKMRDVSGGMMVRMKMYNGDKVIATQDLRDYSLAALDDSLFDVPTDYKQVSEADFSKAESDAMMKGMMGKLGQFGQPAADGAKDAASGAASDAADSANTAADHASQAPANAADSAGNAASDAVNAAKDAVKKKIKIPGLPF